MNSYLRRTQTEERLNALALIHINYPELNVDEMCKLFREKDPRRLENACSVFDS